jgi:acyl-CoA synthetase (AMP-forming)/AMP-acid ligase II
MVFGGGDMSFQRGFRGLVESTCVGCIPVPIIEMILGKEKIERTENVTGKRAQHIVTVDEAVKSELFGEVDEKPDDRFLAQQLLEAFEALPDDKPILEIGGKTYDAGWVFDRAKSVAAGFLARKLRRGDIVLLAVDYDAEAVAIVLGVLLAGGCCAPIDPSIRAPMIAHSMLECTCRYIITDEKYAEVVEDACLTTIAHHQFVMDHLFIRGRKADGKDPMFAARSEVVRPWADFDLHTADEYEGPDRERPDRDPSKIEPALMTKADAVGDSAAHLSGMVRQCTCVYGSAAVAAQLQQFKMLIDNCALDMKQHKFIIGASLLTQPGLIALLACMLYADQQVVLPTAEQFRFEEDKTFADVLPIVARESGASAVMLTAPALFELAATANKSNIGTLKRVVGLTTMSSRVLGTVAARLEARWPVCTVSALCGSPEVGIIGICPSPSVDASITLFPWTEAKAVKFDILTDEDKLSGGGCVPVGQLGRIGVRGPQTMTSFANDYDGTAAIQFDTKYAFFRLAEQSGMFKVGGNLVLADMEDDEEAETLELFVRIWHLQFIFFQHLT